MSFMNGRPLVFTDTNFLVYALSESPDVRHAQARSIFQELIAEERLCLSTQVLQELYVTLTKKLGIRTEVALGVLVDLGEYPVFVIDPTAIREAGRLAGDAQISFWDALVVVAARRMGAEVLLTEDLNAGQRFGELRVENPFRSP